MKSRYEKSNLAIEEQKFGWFSFCFYFGGIPNKTHWILTKINDAVNFDYIHVSLAFNSMHMNDFIKWYFDQLFNERLRLQSIKKTNQRTE